MTAAPSYVVVPAGELLGPYWQAIMRLPDGHKIVCVALQLRDMAVLCNAGGAICHPSGKPLTLPELAAVLGMDVVWLEPVMLRVLAPAGLVAECGDGWRSADPTTARHFARLAGRTKGIGDSPPELILEAEPPKESKTERHLRLGRNRKNRADYRRKWGVEPEVRYVLRDLSVTKALPERYRAEVTPSEQTTGLTKDNPALPNNIVCDGITPSSYNDDGDELPDITPLLNNIPPAERNKITPRINKCLLAGHSLRDCQQAIDSARAEASRGLPWLGLAHHKLDQLAAVVPLPQQVKNAQKTTPAGSEEQATTPWELIEQGLPWCREAA